MTAPRPSESVAEAALFDAAQALQARGAPAGRPPAAVILCHQPALLQHALGRRLLRPLRARRVAGFQARVYRLQATGGRVAVAGGFGVGGPAVGVLVEELAAWGVARIVSIGLAGGLQTPQESGDLLLIASAVREDGVSGHYLPPGQSAAADHALTAALGRQLHAGGAPFSQGAAWTTAAPYRETARQVAGHRAAGVLAVEMEAAALFAVGQVRGVATACLLVVADRATAAGWTLSVDAARCQGDPANGLRRRAGRPGAVNPAIVINAFRRPDALQRLLASVAAAEIAAGTPLLISIDHHPHNQAVVACARAFAWPYGPLEILVRPAHLGMVGHFHACGALSARFGAIVYLEDDLVVSPRFHSFARQALAAYGADARIAAVSLNALWFNGLTHTRFEPYLDDGDTFFLQVPWYQGQVYSAAQWQRYCAWRDAAPHAVTPAAALHPLFLRFPADEWFPLWSKYLVDTAQTVAFPRESLSSNWGDAGTHFRRPTAYFQVPLQSRRAEFRCRPLDETVAVYDAFFEMDADRLRRLAPALAPFDFDVDLLASKPPQARTRPYLLTTRPARRAILRFGLHLRPMEANVIDNVPGREIVLTKADALATGRLARWRADWRRDRFLRRERQPRLLRRLLYALFDRAGAGKHR